MPIHPPGKLGSSPRARGTLDAEGVVAQLQRFIPACAGNTASMQRNISLFAVHPRVRGEHPMKVFNSHVWAGSSPRARGTQFLGLCFFSLERFIPACAGNTMERNAARRNCPVHPRVRGEHAAHPANGDNPDGSSPRARGTRLSPWVSVIPLAGSSPRARGTPHRDRPKTPCKAVHPRVRGEHPLISTTPWRAYGSSPRARGTPLEPVAAAEPVRFIPACAGNTVVV